MSKTIQIRGYKPSQCKTKSEALAPHSWVSHPVTEHLGDYLRVTKPIFTVLLYSQPFHNLQNTSYLLNITFMFVAGATLVKYESDSKDLSCYFARWEISTTAKFTTEALVTNPSQFCLAVAIWKATSLPNSPGRKFWYHVDLAHGTVFGGRP